LGSKTYGAINVGNTSFANDGITQATTARNAHFANQDIFDANDDFEVVGLGGADWSEIAYVLEPGEGARANLVRYDSPEFGGFKFKAHWGADDIWGMALTYSEDIGDFEVVGGIGYDEITDGTEECTETATGTAECRDYGGSISVMHKPSGLFATGSYGVREDEQLGVDNAVSGSDEITHWHVQAGIEQKWTPLGETTVFGGYHDRDTGALEAEGFGDVQIEMYEVGLNQHISAAAMDLYLHYKHYDAEVENLAGVAIPTEAWQTVIGGALVKF
jgi:predicted porin